MELGSRSRDRLVFGFNGGPRNYTLFLGTPRDGIVTEIDNEGAGGAKYILVANLVSV